MDNVHAQTATLVWRLLERAGFHTARLMQGGSDMTEACNFFSGQFMHPAIFFSSALGDASSSSTDASDASDSFDVSDEAEVRIAATIDAVAFFPSSSSRNIRSTCIRRRIDARDARRRRAADDRATRERVDDDRRAARAAPTTTGSATSATKRAKTTATTTRTTRTTSVATSLPMPNNVRDRLCFVASLFLTRCCCLDASAVRSTTRRDAQRYSGDGAAAVGVVREARSRRPL